jgi:hypothetical protein
MEDKKKHMEMMKKMMMRKPESVSIKEVEVSSPLFDKVGGKIKEEMGKVDEKAYHEMLIKHMQDQGIKEGGGLKLDPEKILKGSKFKELIGQGY